MQSNCSVDLCNFISNRPINQMMNDPPPFTLIASTYLSREYVTSLKKNEHEGLFRDLGSVDKERARRVETPRRYCVARCVCFSNMHFRFGWAPELWNHSQPYHT